MARNEGMEYGEAFGSAVASRRGKKKAAAKKPAAKKGNLKPGGSYTSGRAIPLGIPGAKKKVKGKAVPSRGSAMRKADASDASKRRISGTTRARGKY